MSDVKNRKKGNNKLFFRINNFLKLKLEDNKTVIYINDKKIDRYCRKLLINIPKKNIMDFKEVKSIDHAVSLSNYYESSMEDNLQELRISKEAEFWAHCSNLQVWAEHNYDTRILHSNLAFPLLKNLAKAGDPLAKRVFKEEIARRFMSKYIPVASYLIKMGYLRELNKEELKMVMECCGYDLINNPDFLRLTKKDNIIWLQIGNIFYALKDYENCLASVKRAIDIDDTYSNAWLHLGRIYHVMEGTEKTIDCYLTAINLDANNKWAYVGLGIEYRVKQKYNKAIFCNKKALKIDPTFVSAMVNLGFDYLYLEDYDTAFSWFYKCLEHRPDYFPAFKGLGMAYQVIGNYDIALICYNKALNIEPHLPTVLYNKASIEALRQNVDVSIACLNKAIKFDSKYIDFARDNPMFNNLRELKSFMKIMK